MAEYTPNFNLSMPEQTDTQASFIEAYRENMGIIDDNMGGGGGSAEIIEMTQAEYDALPDTKLTDGVLRAIKDEYSPADSKLVGLGDCYSTTEKQVGCWIDGKPLYQKTINFGAIPNNTSKDVAHNISDLGDVVSLDGVMFSSNTFETVPSGEDSNFRLLATATVIRIVTNANWSSWTGCYITIQYTKTTDTAGSGTWTPEGVPAHHYSTNEQVIGTYLNKPLYERVIEINNPDYNWSVINLESYFPNVEKAFLGDMFRATRTDGVVICKPDFYYTDYDRLSFLIAENADNLRVSGYLLSKVAVSKLEFSVRYTKTTD